MSEPGYTWDDFPLVDVPDPRSLAVSRDPVTVHHDGRAYWKVGDSGWHMVVCWYAGPDRAVRVRDEPGWHTVHTRVMGVGPGADSSHTAPRTEADQDIIEDAVNGFLTEAGLAPRPRGYTWCLELPAGRPLDGLWRLVTERERTLPSRAPSADETATAIETAVRDFFHERTPS